MKTLVVLTALAAVTVAGPTFRGDDSDLDINKEKRSPTFGSLHHHLPLPIHHHQPYVQPIIPHHLGLKKPLIVSQPYGHHGLHGHIFRSDDEQLEAHSTEVKESKKTCMKEMEAKCDDEISARSSESEVATKVEDIDGSVSDSEVAQSLKMAKEAVDTLQKKLQLAEKNPRMTQWKHGESQADGNMHENVETAKLALEHIQRNFGNLESMNVHARAFNNAEVHDANLKLEPAFKSSTALKTDEERIAQWKDSIETIQKNVELVRNIEDRFQNTDHSEKSAALEKSSSLNHEISDDHQKKGAIVLNKEKNSDMRDSDMKMAQNMEKKSHDDKSSWQAREHEKMQMKDMKMAAKMDQGLTNDKSSWQAREHEKMQTADMKMAEKMDKALTNDKSSWQAREHEKSFDSKNEMETSASSLSETKTNLHSANEQVSKSESIQSEKNIAKSSIKSSISQPSQTKSSENVDMQQAKQAHIEIEMESPLVDTTTFMKAVEHNQAEQHRKIQHVSSNGHSLHKEHDVSSHDHHRMSAEHHVAAQTSHLGHEMNSPHDHEKSPISSPHAKEAHESKLVSLDLDLAKAKENRPLDHDGLSIPTMHGKEAHEMTMKSSDQFAGQSQLAGVAVKPAEAIPSGHYKHDSEKLHHSLSHDAHGKSAEGGSLFAPIGMNSDLKEAFVPMKSAQSRGAYGSGIAGLSSYGSGYGSGSGSGAVGVFPSAHVGGCAIPLLLSCSPNVVAGHLAKSHSYAAPSYGASGYRSSDNHSSHSKRDITKITRPSKINRTPTNKGLQQKNILITEKI